MSNARLDGGEERSFGIPNDPGVPGLTIIHHRTGSRFIAAANVVALAGRVRADRTLHLFIAF